jgi:MFS family permease
MLQRFRMAQREYPSQFWLMFWGMLISTIGSSMIWPFLMIYVSERLNLPLVEVASLMTLNAIMGLVFSFITGPIADRLGRKAVMVVSLAGNGLGYLLLSQAHTLPVFAILMAFNGAMSPLYRVGADAMMADLVPAEKRPDAYSLLRMSNNLGVALGPAIGGFLASTSYTITFLIAFIGMLTYSLLMAFFGKETLSPVRGPKTERFAGYGEILRDRKFISFASAFTLTQICSAMMWVLLSVYTKQNFQLPESQYGLIPATNATMVVLFQLAVTQVTKYRPPLKVLAIGTLFYAVGVGSIAMGNGFWGFWISVVVMTIGELILIPTSTTYTANLAPAEMRGRYMSVYTLTWGFGIMIGPILGGLLNDNLGPTYIWYGGFVVGLLGTIIFAALSRQTMPEGKKELEISADRVE